MSHKPTEIEDDFIADGIDISNELLNIEEMLEGDAYDELDALSARIQVFRDHLDVYINQQRKVKGRPRSATVAKLLEKKNG